MPLLCNRGSSRVWEVLTVTRRWPRWPENANSLRKTCEELSRVTCNSLLKAAFCHRHLRSARVKLQVTLGDLQVPVKSPPSYLESPVSPLKSPASPVRGLRSPASTV